MTMPYACTRCMMPTEEAVCPVCGAKTENAQRIRDALPPQTILHGQYLLGAALGIRTANPTLPPEGDTQVTGVVAGEVDFRAEKGQVRVILRDVTLNGERIASGAYWTFYLKADENIQDFLTPGARISMTAEVYHPQGQRNPHGYDLSLIHI